MESPQISDDLAYAAFFVIFFHQSKRSGPGFYVLLIS